MSDWIAEMSKLSIYIIIDIILFMIIIWMFVIGFIEIFRNNKKLRDEERKSGKK